MLKLNNFKGFFLFNEEDLSLMQENYSFILNLFQNNNFNEKNKAELLEQIKNSENNFNIGFFL